MFTETFNFRGKDCLMKGGVMFDWYLKGGGQLNSYLMKTGARLVLDYQGGA